jgi:hypothetical protein
VLVVVRFAVDAINLQIDISCHDCSPQGLKSPLIVAQEIVAKVERQQIGIALTQIPTGLRIGAQRD